MELPNRCELVNEMLDLTPPPYRL